LRQDPELAAEVTERKSDRLRPIPTVNRRPASSTRVCGSIYFGAAFSVWESRLVIGSIGSAENKL
jgi:hypothetical protein